MKSLLHIFLHFLTTRADSVPSDDEDLYSGYNEYPTALATDDLEFDENFQHSARTLESRRPTAMARASARLGTAAGFTRQGTARSGLMTRNSTARPMTGMNGGLNRPMTAVRGAGYTGAGTKNQNMFDSKNGKSSATTLDKPEETPEDKIKQLELKISELIEESVLTAVKDNKKALEIAKEASNKEKSLMKLKEQIGVNEGHDWDITFSVLFNLANQYESNEMYTEALSTYHSITKNKFLVNGTKVKINMGNIYYKQNNPTKAIKMYRMAMDQLSNNTNKDLKLKLMHNMGIIFLQIGHPQDASASFEYIMQEKPSFKTGLHFVVSNYMVGDIEKIKQSFQDLLEVPIEFEEDEEKYSALSDDPVSQLLVEVLKNDKLRKWEKEKKLYSERCILSAARLIAPIVEDTFTAGYHWVTETIKASKHSSLAHALEISKALVFLKQRELGEAIEILKSFEKRESKVATAAATNLSFLFFLQGDINQAEKYGEIAKKADFYNSSAFVNLGNCMFARQEFDQAKKFYMEAIETDSSCIEALYNLGITNQHLKFYEEALECFHKVQSLVRNHSHVTYQIGKTQELMGNVDLAVEWYLKVLALAPTDPGILKKLGNLSEMDGDKQQAYQYFYDCYRYDPSDIENIEWLANYLKEIQMPERAIIFYQRAILLQPDEPQWPLLIANCYLRTANYSQAIEAFAKVYKDNPDNLQALQALARLNSDMGLKDADYYNEELKKLERNDRFASARKSARITSGRETRERIGVNEEDQRENISSSKKNKSGSMLRKQQMGGGSSNSETEDFANIGESNYYQESLMYSEDRDTDRLKSAKRGESRKAGVEKAEFEDFFEDMEESPDLLPF